jgi:hypothetical protein
MLSETTVGIAIVGYILLLVGVCWRELRIRKRIKVERREAMRLEDHQIHMDLVHDEQGIQRDGQEVG